ncbi:MAG: MaoC family dehydratase N-terminal domain-containing protein [Rhodoferax sp.]|nr:MaoC family dehydratase N-terminal domain-containing protein [Rhodoferax sp.]
MKTADGDAAPALSAATLAQLQAWTGNTESEDDVITAAPMRGQAALLDRDDAPPAPGNALPPLWHWLYFLPQQRQSELGPDGHARRGGFLPPVPLPRRMWAGSHLSWVPDNPLRVGDAVQRRSSVGSVAHKHGRSGDLIFVRVDHALHNAQGLALTESHDIVYRAAAQPGDPAPVPLLAATDAAWQHEVVPDAVLLFRYSALTFNGHRIHYDRAYVTDVEGYPGLVVHGPLIATQLLDLVRRHASRAFVTGFDFKLLRPTFDLHPYRLHGQPAADGQSVLVWASDQQGFLTLQGCVTLG